MDLTDDYPGFDVDPFTEPCPTDGCDGTLLVHICSIHPAPYSDGYALSVVSKCSDEDHGRIQNHQPPLSESQADKLRAMWRSNRTAVWKHHEDVYPEELSDVVAERLERLGYI